MKEVKFATHNSINGTHRQGTLTAKYGDIVKVLGKPMRGDGYKVDAEWEVYVEGLAITIYNYKNGKNYCGDDGMNVEDITEWSIGGHSIEVVSIIHKIIFG